MVGDNVGLGVGDHVGYGVVGFGVGLHVGRGDGLSKKHKHNKNKIKSFKSEWLKIKKHQKHPIGDSDGDWKTLSQKQMPKNVSKKPFVQQKKEVL